ncbi:uncharacterized protein LOC116132011 [Pistacia vera]|uniref:uncharacterized protein LOC116132011 n=1 Tax=Pistacia vera TaxID=55513 RepID=UPI001263B58F|nr:uncharacterized protein LOC116132011 [Pistacia vera]
MTGVSPEAMVHQLKVDPDHPPVKQKRRKFAPERNQIVNEEVEKLLSNGHELLSFIDAFSGYNQILIHPDDQEKTAFIMERGTYCYKVMPFGLKNAWATYQRLVNKMFAECLGDTMEVYIDDMLVKSLIAKQYLDHLSQTFAVLRKYNMKLNLAKCSFGVSSGQVAGLSCFISRSADKCHLFFHALKKSKKFEWTVSCEVALQQLKRYLTSPPLLSKPVDGEKLYFYIAVSKTAISTVLVREEETKQLPVYYVSKSLLNVEKRYSQLEKLALALIHACRKLRPYFQCHSIVILTSFPLKKILHKPELSDRLLQWTVELSEFDISYQPRTAVKSQALADFTPNTTTQAESELLCMNSRPPSKWTLLVDGSSNVNGSRFGLVLIALEGDMIQRAIRCGFKCTNNEAEYEALIAGLSLAKEIGAKRLEVKFDSQLVVSQLQGTYQAHDSKMTSNLSMVKELQAQFDEFSIVQIPRAKNSHADALANLGSALKYSSQSSIPLLFMQWLTNWKEQQPNKLPEEAMGVELADYWMTPIVRYLEHDKLPADKNESRRLKARAARFTIHEGQLLRKSFSGPYLKCTSPEEAQRVLAELHEGECGNHAGERSLAHQVITARYY